MFATLRTLFLKWFQPPVPIGTDAAAPEPASEFLPDYCDSDEHPTETESQAVTAHAVPYDENLLERARTQWQFGDWENLAKLNRDALVHHPDRAKLALLAAAGRLQVDQIAEAKQYIRLAKEWGVNKKLLVRILAAGVHNNLGRAAAIAGEEPRALQHFHSAVATGTPGSEVRLIASARIYQQYHQLGLPPANFESLPDTASAAPTFLDRECC